MRILAVIVALSVTVMLMAATQAVVAHIVTPHSFMRWAALCREYSPIVPAFIPLFVAPAVFIAARRKVVRR